MVRYVFFAIVVLVSVGLDQWTKQLAIDNLASRSSRWNHGIERVVDAEQHGMTLEEWIADEFGVDMDDPEERQTVRGLYLVDPTDASGDGETGPLSATYRVERDSTLRIYHREVVVVPGFWNHIYVQNFGAAWGILSQRGESFRRPFFLIVSIIAVVVVMWIFRGLKSNQRVMMTALSLIVGGAIGNFIDRVRFGYVIDFIDWYVTMGGEEKHWPTFNIADVAISVGVALMALEILFTPAPKEGAGENDAVGPASGGDATNDAGTEKA